MKSVSGAATLAQKVEFLLTRDQEAQREVNILRERIENLEIESSRRLGQARREIETRFAQELKTALELYRPLRIWGAVALLLGLACMTYANFIS
jgi:predicted nuclease with TOPRIM domain